MRHKVALITGGQRGIGLGIGEALARAGYGIAFVSLPPENDVQVVESLKKIRDLAPCQYYQMDMALAPSEAEQVLHRIEQDLGPVVTFVHNAGIGSPVRGDLLDIQPENFDKVMDVNLRGAFFLAQVTARHMLNQEQGQGEVYRSMSFITSVSAEMVSIERAEYCLSKSASSMMVRLFAVRLAEQGIGVFDIRPGIVATDMTAGVKEKYDPFIQNGLVPSKRWGTPKDIGSVIVPLARGDFAFSTGMSIPVDGGLSIHRL